MWEAFRVGGGEVRVADGGVSQRQLPLRVYILHQGS